jgi:prevent-host-death family protein
MSNIYTAYEAKAKFSELLRKVRSGQRVIISYHGENVAELRPLERPPANLEVTLRELESLGLVGPPASREGDLEPLAKRPGALARFLTQRE